MNMEGRIGIFSVLSRIGMWSEKWGRVRAEELV